MPLTIPDIIISLDYKCDLGHLMHSATSWQLLIRALINLVNQSYQALLRHIPDHVPASSCVICYRERLNTLFSLLYPL